jgi:hypothetical protein
MPTIGAVCKGAKITLAEVSYSLIPKGRPVTNTSKNSANEVFLTGRQVRQRYANASEMWLWRREHDASGFPLPVVIAGRKLWKLSALEAWERSLATKSNQARHLTKEEPPHETTAQP